MPVLIPRVRQRWCTFFLVLLLHACGGSREETIGGVNVPVPNQMKKSDSGGVDVSLLGFRGASASFQGDTDPDKVIEFYKKEMPQRGWTPNMTLVSRGGMLAYSKEGKSVLIATGKNEGTTTLNITVGGTGGASK